MRSREPQTSQAERREPAAFDVERGSLVHAGAELPYEVQGRGPALLALMGLGCPGAGWEPQIPALRKHFRVVTFDQRGTGPTATSLRPIRIGQLARDAVALLDHLGLRRVHLLGVSMGGMTALEVAGRWPERIERLVVGCAPLYADWTMRRLIGGIARRAGATLRRGGLAAARDAVKDAWLPLVFNGQLGPEEAAFVDSQMRAFDDPRASNGVAAQAAAVFFHDARRAARRIRAPALILGGTHDQMIPSRLVCKVAEAVPGSRLVFLEGAPHGVNLVRAAEFNRRVIEFLTQPVDALELAPPRKEGRT